MLAALRLRLGPAARAAIRLLEGVLPPRPAAVEPPLRAELFSAEQLQRHAGGLAGWHSLEQRPDAYRLLLRLEDNAAVIERCHARMRAGVAARERIAPAAEWLLDNEYLIEEEVRTARRHLPRGYSRLLPRLAKGPHQGLPRAYAISSELIAHTDGRVDGGDLAGFVAAYQAVAPLTLGELWAVPIMLRLALIEDLRRVAVRICASHEECHAAAHWFAQMLAVRTPTDLIMVVAAMVREHQALTAAFVAEFARLVQGQAPALTFVTAWFEQRLAEGHLTIEQMVLADHQEQAADQVSIGNAITSLRTLGAIDWREFVEGASLVEAVLRGDPAGIHARMDFATRDRYRHAVEALARRGGGGELAVARAAVALAGEQPPKQAGDDRRRHVGHYLVAGGRLALVRRLGLRPGLGLSLAAGPAWLRLGLYLGPAALATAAVAALVLLVPGPPSWWLLAPGLALAVAASQAALALANRVAMRLVPPQALPRLDFRLGIPAACATLVVVPAMIRRAEDIAELAAALEVRFLGNPDPQLSFALLTDFTDAAAAVLPGDGELLDRACAAILALNRKHRRRRAGIFHLLHRPRRWNPAEGVWMGEERKRGKLADLDRLLLHGDRSAFLRVVGDPARLQGIAFVITLDSDTRLPRDQARLLVGTIAHPLNRARLDPLTGLVVAGHGVLQPRTASGLAGGGRSWYAEVFAGEAGIDPYTRAVSDVYQDLFGEGSFVGKGIYDLHAFSAATGGRFPDNAILSHDLLEGCHARSALVSDVLLVEDSPGRYLADAARRRRWMRGDWQNLWWTLPLVPQRAVADRRSPAAGARRWVANPLSALSRWKVLDNLRRSLVPPAQLALLAAGWLALPGEPWRWTALVLALAILPGLAGACSGLGVRAPGTTWGGHLRRWSAGCLRSLALDGAALILMPFEALLSLEEIARSLWRLLASHRRLLAWQTASDGAAAAGGTLAATYAAMWAAPALALALAAAVLLARPGAAAAALPLALLWLLAPALAWWMGRPPRAAASGLGAGDLDFLGLLARRTWRYFATFVSAEDHWLPPDNYQEYALASAAHRTSPTNMGLALLGNLAARDLGYLTVGGLLERCERTTASMLTMERHRGHFLNWYDTRTLQPLLPRYISTVDSGNLAGHLLVLRAGLAELPGRPLHRPGQAEGSGHTVLGLLACAEAGGEAALARLAAEARVRPAGLAEAQERLLHLLADAELVHAAAAPGGERQWWAGALAEECRAQRAELALLAPWGVIGSAPPPLDGSASSLAGQQRQLDALRLRLLALDRSATLEDLAGLGHSLLPEVDLLVASSLTGAASTLAWLVDLRARLAASAAAAAALTARSAVLAGACTELATMDLGFLYDPARDLFVIGYDVADRRADRSHYDLLASEARLGGFTAIAHDLVPQDHWFALGRQLTAVDGDLALLSWSGSMFEYLMPELVMPAFPGSLLERSNRAVVRRQIAYGRQRGVPWGFSESGCNRTDAQLNYQYGAFGVPGLGFKRGLAEELVVAPYASALALLVDPGAACANLRRLDAAGCQGPFGMYEAIDYTPARLPEGTSAQIVRSYMAHHQGMSLLALDHLLCARPMQRRFLADPRFQATLLLLQERAPGDAVAVQTHAGEASPEAPVGGGNEAAMRVFATPDPPLPEVHLLSNGRYHVMVGAAGGGHSRWKGLAVNRWREDPTCESYGMFCYLRDCPDGGAEGAVWSNTHQPTLAPGAGYEAIFTQSRAEFRRRDHGIECHTQVSVSPEDDVELRRITLTNRSQRVRTIELTSYAEVVAAPQDADASHPAFSNLFVHTTLDRHHHAILASRRARSAAERPAWLFHLMALAGTEAGEASYETDRMRFIGRGRSPARPLALAVAGDLSGSAGPVLDPVAAIRRRVVLQPDQELDVDLVFGMAETREAAAALVAKYHDQRICERVFGLSWTHSQVVLRQIGASEADAQLYGRLAGAIIHPLAARRAPAAVLAQNRRGQAGLWAYGISGDLPLVLLRIGDGERLELVRELIRAHRYWRAKGLIVDLVIWNEDHSGYRQVLHDQIAGLVSSGSDTGLLDRPGGIFVRRSEQMTEEDRILVQTVARLVVSDRDGSLAQFADRRARLEAAPPALVPLRERHPPVALADPALPTLVCGNGLGGFTPDGREYILALEEGATTPLPWVNVIANPGFGTVAAESGAAYTWAGNSHEYRLTTWHNDPVADPCGEAFYLRDEDSGRFWSPAPAPARGEGRYVVRHGFGYSAYAHQEDGLACEMLVYVAVDAPVKLVTITVRNRSRRARRLSLTGYWEWVLGERRHQSAMHVVTAIDAPSGVLTARNPYHPECGGRIAFVEVSERRRTVLGDRGEFLGRNRGLDAPQAMGRQRLSGRVGAGLDPCAALQASFELAEDEVRELVFVLGAGESIEEVRQLARRHCSLEGARRTLEQVWEHWRHTLGGLRVETPDPALDILANGWLPYQTIACRMWARSGFYQSGGAFGFRDQLQDAMALLHLAPALLRSHILLAAAHQFREGDVQHWWHPPGGRGVRTRCSDDFLWLPLAVARYCLGTGDTGVLAVEVAFLEGRALRAEEESSYDRPAAGAVAPLYEHCVRAIVNALRWGPHGLPLMGGGDWNDGMNLVGAGGRGESVWLAFFLHHVLERFAPVAEGRGDAAFARRCRQEAAGLAGRTEAGGWDGAWYRRAYFDDGTPLGSAANEECRIDALPQSWAVLSGAADGARARQAMEEVDRRLVDRPNQLIRLFTPPFDTSALDPGYVKGYIPGVRENGGQYTHAAIWTVMAFAGLGDRERAWELWSLINPIALSATPAAAALYRAEPYVVAADVYGQAPHTGRAGWSWYTGSAGWMYRLLTESLLGLQVEPGRLRLVPLLPAGWKGFTMDYCHHATTYRIQVVAGGGAPPSLTLDGVAQDGPWLALADDQRPHAVTVVVEAAG